MDLHLVLAMHLKQLPDGAIFSWWPVEPHQLQAAFSEWDNESWMHASVPAGTYGAFRYVRDPTKRNLVRDRIVVQLRQFHDVVRLHLFHPQKPDSWFGLQDVDANLGVATVHATPGAQRQKMERTMRGIQARWKGKPLDDLIRFVYQEYPTFAANSKLQLGP